MKKYIELKAGDILTSNDERVSNKGYEIIEAEAIGTIVDRFHEDYKIFRRPVQHTGDVQFLMAISILVPVIVKCDGLAQDEIEMIAGDAVIRKIKGDVDSYVCHENVDWENCEVDEIQPEPKNPGKYRMLTIGDVTQVGDEWQESENGWREAAAGYPVTNDSVPIRRPVTEPQKKNIYDDEGNPIFRKSVVPRYRPFREGDVVEEGDQAIHDGKWKLFHHLCWGDKSDSSIIGNPKHRKLIK